MLHKRRHILFLIHGVSTCLSLNIISYNYTIAYHKPVLCAKLLSIIDCNMTNLFLSLDFLGICKIRFNICSAFSEKQHMLLCGLICCCILIGITSCHDNPSLNTSCFSFKSLYMLIIIFDIYILK